MTLSPHVHAFEMMKIRILNGGHATIAYPGGLMDIEHVHEAMAHPLIRGFLDKVEREGERGLAIHYNKDRVNAGEVLAAVNAMGHGIVDVSTREADLEDVFLNLTRSVA